MNQIKKNSFEIEINGLRGLAILLVVLFHYEIYPFSGGFIGVDIFFVISGYLIGKIIENKNLNFLNYKEFLFKRVKRIFPGLFFLLIISFIFFSFLLSPEHLIEFSKSLISNLLLIPNFYFWTESNYFDVSSNYKPLLHTWSLGVEYHFYLIWPLLVWIIKDLFKDKFFLNLFFIVFIIFSLFFNLYVISFAPVFENKFLYGKYVSDTIFYLSPFRIFEFVFGYLLVINKKRIKNNFINEIIFVFGFLLIIYAALSFDGKTLFPSTNALFPTIGAFLLIFSKDSFFSNKILKNEFINYLGNISFSLYLYHWPVLIFYKYYKFTDLTLIEKFLCIILSIFFAHLSFRYIEKPYLNKKEIFPKKNILILTSLTILCLSAIYSNGWQFRLSNSEKNVLTSIDNQPGGICEKNQKIKKNSDCLYGDINNLDILLVGDSHGKALFQGLKNFSKINNLNLLTFEDMCNNYPSYNNADINNCTIDVDVPKTMIIGKKFYDYQIANEDLEKISRQYLSAIVQIKNNSHFDNLKRIIIIGQVPEFFSSYGDLTSCLTRPFYINKKKCNNQFNKKNFMSKKNTSEVLQNHAQKKKLNNFFNKNIAEFYTDDLKIYFFDPFDYFCDDEICSQINGTKLIYSDATHLSVYGSNFLIEKIKNDLSALIN